jgi:hypothetical protein
MPTPGMRLCNRVDTTLAISIQRPNKSVKPSTNAMPVEGKGILQKRSRIERVCSEPGGLREPLMTLS